MNATKQLIIIQALTIAGADLTEGQVFNITGWDGSDPIIMTETGKQARLPQNAWQEYTEETGEQLSAPQYPSNATELPTPQDFNAVGSNPVTQQSPYVTPEMPELSDEGHLQRAEHDEADRRDAQDLPDDTDNV